MTKKFFLFLNLLLVVVFACKLFALRAELKNKGSQTRKAAHYRPVVVKRLPVAMNREYRHIFASAPAAADKKVLQPGASRPGVAGNGSLSELIIGDEVIRVTGIFISGTTRIAVMSICSRKKKRRKKAITQKVSIGDHLKEFTVVSISPGSVCLEDDATHRREIRIFNHSNP